MLQVVLLKYWKEITLALAAVAAIALGYKHIYDQGYAAAVKDYQAEVVQRQVETANSIRTLEQYSTSLIQQNAYYQTQLTKDLKTILSNQQKKPVFVVENGKCNLSKDFLDSYNELISRGNKK